KMRELLNILGDPEEVAKVQMDIEERIEAVRKKDLDKQVAREQQIMGPYKDRIRFVEDRTRGEIVLWLERFISVVEDELKKFETLVTKIGKDNPDLFVALPALPSVKELEAEITRLKTDLKRANQKLRESQPHDVILRSRRQSFGKSILFAGLLAGASGGLGYWVGSAGSGSSKPEQSVPVAAPDQGKSKNPAVPPAPGSSLPVKTKPVAPPAPKLPESTSKPLRPVKKPRKKIRPRGIKPKPSKPLTAKEKALRECGKLGSFARDICRGKVKRGEWDLNNVNNFRKHGDPFVIDAREFE
ncbi:MAG: hypothetical protein ABIA67_05110, partial [Candidatus Margulisiibacteriota bacterium]